MPAKRADVVQRGVDLIDPKREDRDRCKIEVKLALLEVATKRRDLPYIFHRRNKDGKRAALKVQHALENLRATLIHHELPDDVGLVIRRNPSANPLFPHLPTLTKNEVDAWLTDEIDRIASVQERKPSDFKDIDSELKRIAASEAHELIERFNSSKRFPLKRFHELTALLYGDPDVKLVAYACRIVREVSLQSGGRE